MLKGLKNWREPKKLWQIFTLLGLALLVIIIFAQKIEFSAIDLGRHLENGRLVFQDKDVLFKNFYSYTEPEQTFINHHWFSGVIFYGSFLLGGFKLLSLFNIFLALIVFFTFFRLAYKRAGFYLSVLMSLPAILLFNERVEIRPEIFSYFFIALTWLIWESKKLNSRIKTLITIPIFIFWANLHIYFFIGLALVAFKLLENFLWKFTDNQESIFKARFLATFAGIKKDIFNFLILTSACLLTPNHWRGPLYPFNIFKNYGYQIAENKSIFYLQNLTLNYNFNIFKLLLALLFVGLVANWFFYRRIRWFDLFFGIFISALALFASRNLALFGLVAMVIISSSLRKPLEFFNIKFYSLFDKLMFKIRAKMKFEAQKYLPVIPILLILALAGFFIKDYNGQHNFLKGSFGLGLGSGEEDSFNFFKDSGLSGPIFNNYDSGSALIFGLGAQEPVFVDNRPEAYSLKFFSDTYLPMQTDKDVWKKTLEEYKFKTIYFSYADQTPWGTTFLKNILADDDWALVYFDRSYVILALKSETPSEILDKYTLDDRAFRNKLRQLAKNSNIQKQFYLGSLAQSYGAPDLAEEIYRQILLEQPRNHRAVFSLAYFYSAFSNRDSLLKSIFYFNRGLKLEDSVPGIYSQRAMVYWNLGDYKQAEIDWRYALKINRHDVDALYYLEQIKDLKKQGRLPRD